MGKTKYTNVKKSSKRFPANGGCMKIFLASRSNETSYKNFLSIIESGVDYTLLEPYLDKGNKGNK